MNQESSPPRAVLLFELARRLTGDRPHLLVVGATLLIFAASFVLAWLLRFEFAIPSVETTFMRGALPFVLGVKLLVFFVAGVYRILWAYIGIRDVWSILRASLVATAAVLLLNFLLFRDSMLPRSVLVLDGVLTFLAVGGLYVLLRHLRESAGSSHPIEVPAEPVLIVGAGDAGEALLREIQRNTHMGARVVGFVDDAPQKNGHSLRGVPILGGTADLREIAYRHGVRKAFVAIPSAGGSVMRRIVTALLHAGLAVKVLPPLAKSAHAKGYVPQLRPVSMEDLLRREPIKLDDQAISAFIRDKVVLVTGAAGSIGSELCRQILDYHPAKLVALDLAETPLHDLLLELQSRVNGKLLVPELADVTDEARIGRVFDTHRPVVVFHAAALKHVPMMELHPREAARVNVGGTRILAEAARRGGVGGFVLVSTDKAVNPSSVMGATKRVAEMVVQAQNREGSGRFMAVRFGNVLGSNGSVLRIFQAQLERGGPLTVTHPDMKRYFMTIPEAVQLVLQAAVLGKDGDILELDMGQPVRIVDLAEDLIRLSGLTPHVDIKIEFTGVRPGEKIFEELFQDSERMTPTAHPQVSCIRSERDAGLPKGDLAALCDAALKESDPAALSAHLLSMARR